MFGTGHHGNAQWPNCTENEFVRTRFKPTRQSRYEANGAPVHQAPPSAADAVQIDPMSRQPAIHQVSCPLLTRGGKESCFDRTMRVTCASDGEHFACRASLDIMCAVSCDGLVHCVPCFPGAIQARGCEAGLVQPSLPLDLAMQLVALLPRGRFSFVDKASAGDLQPYR